MTMRIDFLDFSTLRWFYEKTQKRSTHLRKLIKKCKVILCIYSCKVRALVLRAKLYVLVMSMFHHCRNSIYKLNCCLVIYIYIYVITLNFTNYNQKNE